MFSVDKYLEHTAQIGVTEMLEIELTVSMIDHKNLRFKGGKA